LAKARRLVPELEKMRGQKVRKTEFLDILSRHIREPFGNYISLLLVETCDREDSEV
jgi:hypothetical protein